MKVRKNFNGKFKEIKDKKISIQIDGKRFDMEETEKGVLRISKYDHTTSEINIRPEVGNVITIK